MPRLATVALIATTTALIGLATFMFLQSQEQAKKRKKARAKKMRERQEQKLEEVKETDQTAQEEAVRTLSENPLDGATFLAILREVIREMEWVSLTTLLQDQAIRAQLQQDMQNMSPQFIEKMAQRQNMQPDELIQSFKSNPQFASAMLQQTVQGIISSAEQEFAAYKQKQLVKYMDRACAARNVSNEQLDAYKKLHGAEVAASLSKLTAVMRSTDLPDADPPAGFTKEKCLEYMRRMHALQEDVLSETLEGKTLTETGAGEMPKELEALVSGEAFEGNAQKAALEKEYGLVSADHKAEVLLQKFVLTNTADMEFMMKVQELQQKHVQNVQERVKTLRKAGVNMPDLA